MRNIIKNTLKQAADDYIRARATTLARNHSEGNSNTYEAILQCGIKYPGLNYSQTEASIQSDPELKAIADGK